MSGDWHRVGDVEQARARAASGALPVLAVDPGQTGAACLLDRCGRRVLMAWQWTKLSRVAGDVYRVRTTDGREEEAPTLHEVGLGLVRDAEFRCDTVRYLLVVEGLFVARKRGKRNVSPQSAIPLGEACGMLMGPLLAYAEGQPWRPLASEWRPEALSLPARASADAAEAYAVKMARAQFTGLRGLAENGHVCEAAWMARLMWARSRRNGVG